MCGSWMDRAARPLVIQWGIGLQCAGVALALCVLGLLVASRPQGASPQGAAAAGAAAERLPVGLLLAMIGCGSLEVLGAMISSVAVKKDWVTPTLTPTLTLTLTLTSTLTSTATPTVTRTLTSCPMCGPP